MTFLHRHETLSHQRSPAMHYLGIPTSSASRPMLQKVNVYRFQYIWVYVPKPLFLVLKSVNQTLSLAQGTAKNIFQGSTLTGAFSGNKQCFRAGGRYDVAEGDLAGGKVGQPA
ncbi:hypothetical protein ONS95_012594 [Cadophora gregata]|uniref:uncharacterized protein n=1 Tax=Cadophora gregata TaxID=51156 RepID=UPI0026DA7606|nr:uncharacterized protein ONS95_012594 [Cadophora gregata]KAK0118300.1 hypothetical protein ONS95_012594 [Cadophora gregata]